MEPPVSGMPPPVRRSSRRCRMADEILRAAISPDGKSILDRRLWRHRPALGFHDRASRSASRSFTAGPSSPIAFSPDGKTVLTGSMDRTARLWNAANGEPRSAPLRHESELVFRQLQSGRPDGHHLQR